jgi:hypothetical protein
VKRVLEGVRSRCATLRALWRGPFWWLVPVVCFFVPIATVLIALQAVPLVAPFVYLLF